VLQSVEDLLQRKLNAGKYSSMRPGKLVCSECAPREGQHRRAGGDEQWNVCDHETETDDSAGGGSHRGEESSYSDATRPAGVDVGVESDYHARGVNGQHCGGHLARIHQIVAATADIDRASQLSEESSLRFPGNSVSEPTLYLKTFFTLHPGVDRGEHITRCSRNRSGGGRESGSRDLRDQPALIGHVDTRSFFGECLIERRRAKPDFVSYVEELTLADQIAGFGKSARALELRCTGEHTLECLAIKQRLERASWNRHRGRRFLVFWGRRRSHAELYLRSPCRKASVNGQAKAVVSVGVEEPYAAEKYEDSNPPEYHVQLPDQCVTNRVRD